MFWEYEGDYTEDDLTGISPFSCQVSHECTKLFQEWWRHFHNTIDTLKMLKLPSIIWVLLGSVSVCKAPISIFTSLSFKERKVTGLSYVELSSLLNFPSRTTWMNNEFISVSIRTRCHFYTEHTSMALPSKVRIHSTNYSCQTCAKSFRAKQNAKYHNSPHPNATPQPKRQNSTCKTKL